MFATESGTNRTTAFVVRDVKIQSTMNATNERISRRLPHFIRRVCTATLPEKCSHERNHNSLITDRHNSRKRCAISNNHFIDLTERVISRDLRGNQLLLQKSEIYV